MAQTAIIIGSGIGGLATACLLAKNGWQVTVVEKNEQVGGRAGVLQAKGFTFDTGPSWYLMPDVFERFFEELGEKVSDHLDLVRLQPSYRVFFKDLDKQVDLFSDLALDRLTFDSLENGAGQALEQYLQQSAKTYQLATGQLLYRNYRSARELLSPSLLYSMSKLNVLSNMQSYVAKYFKSAALQKILQYPLVFLGTNPYNAPALYNFLSHTDLTQGVFYPMGGMYQVTIGLKNIALKHGVKFCLNYPVERIITENKRAIGVITNGKQLRANVVISNADPYHTETQLLNPKERDHSPKYWHSRTLAPSALLMYLGVDRQYDNLMHHNLLFSQDWQQNFADITKAQTFPSDPSIYVCAPSKTDPSVAPKGKENLFVLVPVAAGLQYTPQALEAFADKILATLEKTMGLPGLRQKIIYRRLFCVDDFAERFNSYQGTGLGLSHTLRQTALFRPSHQSKKLKGLYYVGANTHPGIGVPACLVSAQLVCRQLK